MRSLIIGGTRSGKSAYAERLVEAGAAPGAEVLYVAPGLTTADDVDFAERVAAHRARRPESWRTVETRDVAEVLRENPGARVLVDDVSAWLTATLDAALGWTGDRHVVDGEIEELLAAITAFEGELVLVSAEVGLGVVAPTTSGRQFADMLGALNTRLAEAAESVELVVAGRALPLAGAAGGSPRDRALAAFGTTREPGSAALSASASATAPEGHSEGHHARHEATSTDGAAQRPPRPTLGAGTLAAGTGLGAAGAAAARSDVDSGSDAAAGSPTVATSAAAAEDPPSADTGGTGGFDATDEDFAGLGDVRHYDSPATFSRVQHPDRDSYTGALDFQTTLTKPAGSLGLLEDLAVWYASCRGTVPPPPLDSVSVVVFAGDHGIAEHGVSAYPQDVTTQMVDNILAGGAAVSVLARRFGAEVVVADLAVAGETPEHTRRHKIRRSSGSLDREDALTETQTVAAIAAGRRLADERIDAGADLLIAGDLGIGNTTPASAIIGAITGTEPVVIVGRGTGIDDNAWMRKASAIRDGMFRSRDVTRRPTQLLQRIGGADLAAMAGFLAQAATRRTPVLLDGVVVTSAAMLADLLAPGARNWWRAGHRSAEPAHSIALDYLGLAPILEGGMRLGEGSGALTALPVLLAGVATMREMATFGDAGVSGRD